MQIKSQMVERTELSPVRKLSVLKVIVLIIAQRNVFR